tara:strand:+ start:493 stop:807 length:315 start_codon:yes stop_codon:yes gene_type:complete
MSWANILKLKREEDETRLNRPPERRKRKVPMVGGKDPSKIIEHIVYGGDSLDYVDEDYEDSLAESTREQLIDAFIEKLEELSKEELIKILIKTQGTINVKTPKF